jgi:hypothetical protein
MAGMRETLADAPTIDSSSRAASRRFLRLPPATGEFGLPGRLFTAPVAWEVRATSRSRTATVPVPPTTLYATGGAPTRTRLRAPRTREQSPRDRVRAARAWRSRREQAERRRSAPPLAVSESERAANTWRATSLACVAAQSQRLQAPDSLPNGRMSREQRG